MRSGRIAGLRSSSARRRSRRARCGRRSPPADGAAPARSRAPGCRSRARCGSAPAPVRARGAPPPARCGCPAGTGCAASSPPRAAPAPAAAAAVPARRCWASSRKRRCCRPRRSAPDELATLALAVQCHAVARQLLGAPEALAALAQHLVPLVAQQRLAQQPVVVARAQALFLRQAAFLLDRADRDRAEAVQPGTPTMAVGMPACSSAWKNRVSS